MLLALAKILPIHWIDRVDVSSLGNDIAPAVLGEGGGTVSPTRCRLLLFVAAGGTHFFSAHPNAVHTGCVGRGDTRQVYVGRTLRWWSCILLLYFVNTVLEGELVPMSMPRVFFAPFFNHFFGVGRGEHVGSLPGIQTRRLISGCTNGGCWRVWVFWGLDVVW